MSLFERKNTCLSDHLTTCFEIENTRAVLLSFRLASHVAAYDESRHKKNSCEGERAHKKHQRDNLLRSATPNKYHHSAPMAPPEASRRAGSRGRHGERDNSAGKQSDLRPSRKLNTRRVKSDHRCDATQAFKHHDFEHDRYSPTRATRAAELQRS